MFKDHYVVALSAAKALQDGQVVALSSAASGPDFLGRLDPTTLGASAAAAQQPPPGNPAFPPPVPPQQAPAPTGLRRPDDELTTPKPTAQELQRNPREQQWPTR